MRAFRAAALLKKIQHRCFKVKLAKFLRTLILKNICKRLLLTMLTYTLQSIQCCPYTAETTLHKNFTGAMLAKTIYKSSHRKYSEKKCVLNNFSVFIGKHLCWILCLIKLQAFSSATLLKGDSNTGVFLRIKQNS